MALRGNSARASFLPTFSNPGEVQGGKTPSQVKELVKPVCFLDQSEIESHVEIVFRKKNGYWLVYHAFNQFLADGTSQQA